MINLLKFGRLCVCVCWTSADQLIVLNVSQAGVNDNISKSLGQLCALTHFYVLDAIALSYICSFNALQKPIYNWIGNLYE